MWWLAREVDAVPAGSDWLAPAEARRAADMRHAKRRIEYALRRLAAKHAVAAVLGLPTDPAGLARIEVANAPDGSPFVLVGGAPAGLDLSLSDRAGRAVCLVGLGAIGCDLEIVEPRSDGFVRDFLTAAERRYAESRPDGDARQAAVNLVWSAKESALKVLRTGLRRDTRSVEVTVHHGRPRCWAPLTVATTGGPTLHGWWRRDGDYLFTTASETAGAPPIALESASRAIPRASASAR